MNPQSESTPSGASESKVRYSTEPNATGNRSEDQDSGARKTEVGSPPSAPSGGSSRISHWVAVAVLAFALTVLGWFLAARFLPLPKGYSAEARISDEAFRILVYLAVPVFSFVVAMFITSIASFVHKGEIGSEDGPPLQASNTISLVWLVITGGLAVFVMIHPGITGLRQMRAGASASHTAHSISPASSTKLASSSTTAPNELVIAVEGVRWSWKVSYPDYGVTTNKELVLPVGQRIKFEVTSKDVLHSFWIPAMRVKIDAVPGRTTVVYARPEREGSFSDDPQLRLQCAELCGLAHSSMAMPVRILSSTEFDSWIQANQTQTSSNTQGGAA